MLDGWGQSAYELYPVDLRQPFDYDVNGQGAILVDRRPFDRSRLIRQAGIGPESRRPTEGARDSGHDKDFKTVSIFEKCRTMTMFTAGY